MQSDENYLLYDGDCPFCSNYVRMMRLRKAAGPIALLNMRDHPELAAHHRAQGYDLNQGMLLHLDGCDYWGADAIWWSFPASALCAMTMSIAYYRWGRWREATMLPIDPRKVALPAEVPAQPPSPVADCGVNAPRDPA